MTLRADDRVLLLDIPADRELVIIARILSHGALVALGDAFTVDRARAALAEFDNVMFVEADPQKIPWRDQFFSVIVVPPHMQAAARSSQVELTRLLAPNGRIEGLAADV